MYNFQSLHQKIKHEVQELDSYTPSNLVTDNFVNTPERSQRTQYGGEHTPRQGTSRNIQNESNSDIDYVRINRMIEQSLAQMIRSLNLSSNLD